MYFVHWILRFHFSFVSIPTPYLTSTSPAPIYSWPQWEQHTSVFSGLHVLDWRIRIPFDSSCFLQDSSNLSLLCNDRALFCITTEFTLVPVLVSALIIFAFELPQSSFDMYCCPSICSCRSSLFVSFVFLRGSIMAIEPYSSFPAIDPQVLMHDVPWIAVELQGLVLDEETHVLMGVRIMRDEDSCDIVGDTWR